MCVIRPGQAGGPPTSSMDKGEEARIHLSSEEALRLALAGLVEDEEEGEYTSDVGPETTAKGGVWGGQRARVTRHTRVYACMWATGLSAETCMACSSNGPVEDRVITCKCVWRVVRVVAWMKLTHLLTPLYRPGT
jgi:hypothetical protein